MRVNYVKRAAKETACDKCRKVIKKGDPYKWAKGRSTGKKIRCEELGCKFRPSDLTGSDKLARLYGAQEAADDALGAWIPGEGLAALEELCAAMAEELRDVSNEYRDAAEAMGAAGGESEEKADNIEEWADEIQSAAQDVEPFVVEAAKGGNKNADGQTIEEWAEDIRAQVSEVINSCPL